MSQQFTPPLHERVSICLHEGGDGAWREACEQAWSTDLLLRLCEVARGATTVRYRHDRMREILAELVEPVMAPVFAALEAKRECVWTFQYLGVNQHDTGCGYPFAVKVDGYKFCGYCGGTLKVGQS